VNVRFLRKIVAAGALIQVATIATAATAGINADTKRHVKTAAVNADSSKSFVPVSASMSATTISTVEGVVTNAHSKKLVRPDSAVAPSPK
jgi:hypothetical protein